jgi:RNA polymerase sigma factor (sigma-70 family)
MPRRHVSSPVCLPPFQALIDAHGRDVHRFLVAMVGATAADDCYQETWIAALRAYPRLRDASNLRAWLLTIAQRKSIDFVRSRRRQAIPVGEAPERADAPAPATDTARLDGDEELWRHVRELPPKQRTAVALRYVFDSAHSEIGSAMGISEDAARRNVHEGLKRLRAEYQR